MLECELKFPVESFTAIERKLLELGCVAGPPVAERNLVFDSPDGPLRASGRLLRLREEPAGVLLTVKTPVEDDRAKVRREYETRLACGLEEASILLQALGYEVVFEYGKKRRSCRMFGAAVCLDELDFGRFVELEAEAPETLAEAASLLGLDARRGSALSYMALAGMAARRG